MYPLAFSGNSFKGFKISFFLLVTLISISKYAHAQSAFKAVSLQADTAVLLVTELEANLGILDESGLMLKRTRLDALTGNTIERKNQHKDGVLIEGADLVVHHKSGEVKRIIGQVFTSSLPSSTPLIDSVLALNLALAAAPSALYAWEFDSLESKPKPRLVYIEADGGGFPEMKLSYRVDIASMSPVRRNLVYIDAQTGIVMRNYVHEDHFDISLTGKTLFNGDKQIIVDSADMKYRLEDYSRSADIITRSRQNDEITGTINAPIEDTDTYFDVDPDAVSVHWATEKAWDIIDTTFSESMYINTLRSFVHVGDNWANAAYNGYGFFYGDGNGSDSAWVSLDLVGHELMHKISDRTVGLIYSHESGALAESYSDIFGEVLEYYATGTNDWLLGADFRVGGVRSMVDPHSQEDAAPKSYFGLHWEDYGADLTVCNSFINDNCGVHHNCSVMNHWFYLLSVGDTGTSETGYNYNVTGIGIEDAARVVFRTLENFTTSSSNYVKEADFSVDAAKELFGDTSFRTAQVIEAWCAVGLGPCDFHNSSIDVLYPAGGESFIGGNTVSIQWDREGADLDSLILEFSANGGLDWQPIEKITADGTSFLWEVPQINTPTASIRIISDSLYYLQGLMDSVFSINPCIGDASFLSDVTGPVCIGDTINFSSTASIDSSLGFLMDSLNFLFLWYVNDTPKVFGKDFTYVASSTDFEVTLAVIGALCIAEESQKFEAAPTDADFFHEVSYRNISLLAPAADSYLWDIGGLDTLYTRVVDYTFQNDGMYNICLSIVNTCGLTMVCDSVEINQRTPDNSFYGKVEDYFSVKAVINDETIFAAGVRATDSLNEINFQQLIPASNPTPTSTFKSSREFSTVTYMSQLSDGSTIVGGRICDDCDTSAAGIIKFESNGEVAWANEFIYDKENTIGGIIENEGQVVVLLKTNFNNSFSTADFVLAALDFNGNLLNAKRYGVGGQGERVGGGFPYKDGFLVYGHGDGFDTLPTRNGVFISFMNDSLGIDSTLVIHNNIGSLVSRDLESLPGGGYVLAVNRGSFGMLIAFDENFNTTWSYELDETTIYDLGVATDGDILVGCRFEAEIEPSATDTRNGLLRVAKDGSLATSYWFDSALTRVPVVGNIEGSDFIFGQKEGVENDLSLIFFDDQDMSCAVAGSGAFSYDTTLIHRTSFSFLETSVSSLQFDPITYSDTFILMATDTLCYTLPCTNTSNFFLPGSFCLGDTTYLSPELSLPGELAWFENGELYGYGDSLAYSPSKEGPVEIMLIYERDSTCSDTSRKYNFVAPLPASISIDSIYYFCDSPSLSLSLPFDLNYVWQLDSMPCPDCDFPLEEFGDYELTISDDCGNVSALAFSIRVDTNCVYPGDMNYDGIVDNEDLLIFGQFFGSFGPPRDEESTNWEPQPAQSWGISELSEADIKHVDGNGDGIIDMDDFCVVLDNYNFTHPNGNTIVSDLPTELTLNIEIDTGRSTGDTVYFDVVLEDSFGLSSIYGTAFRVDFSSTTVSFIDFMLEPGDSWLGTDDEMIEFSSPTYDSSYTTSSGNYNIVYVDMTITRLDHSNRTGPGKLVTAIVVIEDNELTGDPATVNIEAEDATMVNSSGYFLPVGVGGGATFTAVNEFCPDISGVTSTVSPAGVLLAWNRHPTYDGILVQGRPVGAPGFGSIFAPTASDTFINSSILSNAITTYEWFVRTRCTDITGGFTFKSSDTLNFTFPPTPKLSAGQMSEIFPNPANDVVYIRSLETISRVVVSDMTGRKVIEAELTSDYLGTDKLANGVYNLEVGYENGETESHLLVIER